MIDLNATLDTIAREARDQFPGIEDIETHPGEFTETELRRFHVGRVALRLAMVNVGEVQVGGTGTRTAQANMALFVVAADRQDNQRTQAALAVVSEAIEWLAHNRFKDDRLLPVDPRTISAENLYSGELDKTTGIAFWGIRWQQRIKATDA